MGGKPRRRQWNTTSLAVVAVYALTMACAMGLSAPVASARDAFVWTQALTTESPVGRDGAAMAYDSTRQRVVLFGGCCSDGTSGTTFNDTWEWDGTSWTKLLPPNSPSVREGAVMTYDSKRGVTVLLGGFANETWEWNGTNWIRRFPAHSPSEWYESSMVFDAARGKTLIFGGLDTTTFKPHAETWQWDGVDWTKAAPASSPPARRSAQLAFDSGRGVATLFGGDNNTCCFPNFSDTWEWDGITWSLKSPAVSPPPTTGAMDYDVSRGESILFGSNTHGTTAGNDTWAWDGTTWTKVQVDRVPAARFGESMAYDAAHRQSVLFGGKNIFGSAVYNDTWLGGLAVAPSVSPTPSPSPVGLPKAGAGSAVARSNEELSVAGLLLATILLAARAWLRARRSRPEVSG